jgi:transposase InsO family protein
MTDLRLEVLREAAEGVETVSAICRRYGISRESYYVYLRRFRAEGVGGLEPRSCEPIHQPRRMAEEIEAAICVMRKEHPKWGARRIRAELTRAGVDPPVISAVHRALVRNNLVAPGRARPKAATQRFERDAPNELWQIDATRVLLADESEVWVMDMLDDHSRFCVAARVARRANGEAALACFEWATRRYGIPTQVLSDNGMCFTGRLKDSEVAFERCLRALGVALVHARPFHPQTCGKLERFHRTMKEWLSERPRARRPGELQRLLDEFRAHYNEERPNQGIDDQTPAERYQAQTASNPPAPPPVVVYPDGTITRKVSSCGNVSFTGHMIRVGSRWSLKILRVTVIDDVVHLFYGDQLVRALIFKPGVKYYGPVAKPKRTAKAKGVRRA